MNVRSDTLRNNEKQKNNGVDGKKRAHRGKIHTVNSKRCGNTHKNTQKHEQYQVVVGLLEKLLSNDIP
jgi:hypothetical protein